MSIVETKFHIYFASKVFLANYCHEFGNICNFYERAMLKELQGMTTNV